MIFLRNLLICRENSYYKPIFLAENFKINDLVLSLKERGNDVTVPQ